MSQDDKLVSVEDYFIKDADMEVIKKEKGKVPELQIDEDIQKIDI